MSQFISVEIKEKGVAVVTMCREPVNSMNLEFWQQLLQALTDLEKNPKVRGVIFTTGLKKDIFTAGNDLSELSAKRTKLERYSQFWRVQTEFLARLYRTHLPTVAAIRGQCPAGGCVLALCCDARVMTTEGNPRIGLNEVALGIAVPPFWVQVMARTIGFAKAEELCTMAIMPTSTEAAVIGLVDKAVPTKDLMATAEGLLQKRLAFPPAGRGLTKSYFRAELSKQWEAAIDKEIEFNWKLLNAPSSIKALEGVIARLSAPKAKL